MILFCLYFEIFGFTKLWAPVQYLMVSIEIVSIEWEGGSAIRWCDNITKYVVCIISNISIQQVFLGPALTKTSDTGPPHPLPPPYGVQCLCRHPVWLLQPPGLVRTRWNVPVSLSLTRFKIALIVCWKICGPWLGFNPPGTDNSL